MRWRSLKLSKSNTKEGRAASCVCVNERVRWRKRHKVRDFQESVRQFIETDSHSRGRKRGEDAATLLQFSYITKLCLASIQPTCFIVTVLDAIKLCFCCFEKLRCFCERSKGANLLQSHQPGNMLRKHLDFRPFDLLEELFSNTRCLLGRWILTAANNLRGGCGARENIKCEGDQKRKTGMDQGCEQYVVSMTAFRHVLKSTLKIEIEKSGYKKLSVLA